MIENFYWLWEKRLSKEFCELVIKESDWEKQEDAKTYKENVLNLDVRKTVICWVDTGSPIGCIAHSYIGFANSLANWNYNLLGLEKMQIGKYENNGFYDWHMDSEKPVEGIQRKLSISILLSNTSDYEGGLLEFQNIDKQPKLEQGSIIVFPSFIQHRITPVTSGVRYSAVTWANGPAFK